MAASPTIQNQELRAEGGINLGRPVKIALDYTVALDVTLLHVMTVADVLDRVTVTLWNETAGAIDVSVIVSPNDDTSTGDVDAATLLVAVAAKSFLVLPELFVRFDSGGNTYVIAAYVAGGNVNLIRVTTRIVRLGQGLLTV